MRLRAVLFAFVALGAVGVAAHRLAGMAASYVERSTAAEVGVALDAAGQGWVRAEVDGLRVALTGAAPDETSRFRTLEIVKQIVDARRIDDATTVRAADPLTPPPFALELLRNEAEVSLIGLVPEEEARDAIRAALEAGGLGGGVTDMLEAADHPAPERWAESLRFGLKVLTTLPRAKIGVEPGRVRVVAVAETDAARTKLEAALRAAAPAGVRLALDISAPRPVIAPFVLDFALADDTARLTACSADSPEAAAQILAAARAAGSADCPVGLGAPSPDWAAAATLGVATVRDLGGGRFELRDFAAVLTGPADGAPGKVRAIGAKLDAELPADFTLTVVAPPRMETRPGGARVYAPRFEAVLHEDGSVRLGGSVQDATSRAAITSFAAALFGHDRVTDATVIDPELPDGWPSRVLAGVEALSALDAGKLRVTRETVAVEGRSMTEGTDAAVEALLAAKVGGAAAVDVRFDQRAAAAFAAAVAAAARPRGEICAEEIAAILDADSIGFAAGGATVDRASHGVIAAIADVLRGCPGTRFEIAGHTDSQGPHDSNLRLGEARARAVEAALRAQDLPLVVLTARGYGEAAPVAANATEPDRARNRRITFTLVPEGAEEPPAEAPPEATADPAAPSPEVCGAKVAELLRSQSIEFGAGSADIDPGSGEVITRIAAALGECPGARFEIGGHTDSQGSEGGNLRLSEDRAQAVLEALVAAGHPQASLSARGYGEAEPVADNATPEGRAQNRRIAFTPLPQAATAAAAPPACAATASGLLTTEPIAFAAGSAAIAPESAGVIAEIAAALRRCPGGSFEIGGHTDSEGSEGGNLRLSQDRAEAVRSALVAQGLTGTTLTARGYGEAEPIADNATAEGRAQNRRIALEPIGPGGGDAAGAAGPSDKS